MVNEEGGDSGEHSAGKPGTARECGPCCTWAIWEGLSQQVTGPHLNDKQEPAKSTFQVEETASAKALGQQQAQWVQGL